MGSQKKNGTPKRGLHQQDSDKGGRRGYPYPKRNLGEKDLRWSMSPKCGEVGGRVINKEERGKVRGWTYIAKGYFCISERGGISRGYWLRDLCSERVVKKRKDEAEGKRLSFTEF